MSSDDECKSRLERRLKRRSIANYNFTKKSTKNSFKVEDVSVDLDDHDDDDEDVHIDLDEHDDDAYDNATCSNDCHDDGKTKKNNEQVGDPQPNMCLDDDVVDPDYKIFLENLREDNQSYVVEFVISDGMSVLIKYERKEGLSDGLKLDSWATLKSCPRRESTETARTPRTDSKRKIQSPNDLGNVSGIERTGKTEARITLRNASKRGKTESPHILSGSSFKKSKINETTKNLSALKIEKTVTPNETTKNLSALKIEKTVTPNVLSSKTRTSRIWRINSQREKAENLNILSNISSTKKRKQRRLTNLSRKESTEAPETLRDVRGKENKNSMRDVKEENEYPFSGGTNGCSYKRYGTTNCNSEVESDTIDENYQEFLNCLGADGENFVFTPASGIPVIYEADAESSGDPEIIAAGKNPFCGGDCSPFISSKRNPIVCVSTPDSGIPLKYEADVESSDDPEIIAMDKNPLCDGYRTPFISSKCDSIIDLDSKRSIGSPGSSSHSQFRMRLMEILGKPYTKEEYDDLLHEVSYKKPLEHQRILRGRTISYALDSFAKSYLDEYPDFRRKIASVQHDRYKVLNLLRGFCFWLKNLAHEGSFKPWKDSSCLRILPRCK
ncbi:uncharacterized protein LOC132167356 isoform X2 [Corylus avellana]|uniref:uncharacterized protein LOC132167356 isoform X2 n=1 Tax=Corylus avellana TaxID=13451 RepID=UPI00286B7EB4|nr:uncharacterized protein LOC132167356 isoform X2 [Corylus avellana]